MKTHRLVKLLKNPQTNMDTSITLNKDKLEYHIPTTLRLGRPRHNWLVRILIDYWDYIRMDFTNELRPNPRDHRIPVGT